MTFAKAIVSSIPRESSGPRTSSRYDFQKNWALCKLLELHLDLKEFLVLMDYHDDVVVLDDETDPQSAIFFQIKTKKSGVWTVSDLTRKSKAGTGSQPQSILEKLYASHKLFDKHVAALRFVSNKAVKLTLKNDSVSKEIDECVFLEICNDEKEKIHVCIEGEGVEFSDFVGLSKLGLSKTLLSLEEHDVHAKGRLAEFLEEHFPGRSISSTVAYRTLFDEIKRKTNNEIVYSEFKNLRKSKGISASEFRKIISLIGGNVGVDELWGTAERYLIKEGVPPISLTSIRRDFYKFAVARMNPVDEDIYSLTSAVQKLLKDNNESWKELGLNEVACRVAISLKGDRLFRFYGESFVKSVSMYEVLNETVQKADPKSEEA